MIESLKAVKDGTASFDVFKDVLLHSDLSDEDVLTILRGKAFESIIVEKEESKFTEIKKEDNPKYKEIDDKVEALIQKYYYLLEEKKTISDNLFKMYEKFLNIKSLDQDNKGHLVDDIKGFSNKEVSLALLITYLISKKQLFETIDNEELKELYYEELESVYEAALEIGQLYDKEKLEELPLDANVYFLLENGKPLFDLDSLNDHEREILQELYRELELGKFDYVRGKSSHARVEQNIRKDINVFVNKKSSYKISFIRVSNENLTDSKVLILSFENTRSRNIYSTSMYILNNKSDLIDDALERIKTQDETFISEQQAFINDQIFFSQEKGSVTHE
jgi:hypothetical protein